MLNAIRFAIASAAFVMAAISLVTPADSEDSRNCQRLIGIWTYTQQGLSGELTIQAGGTAQVVGPFGAVGATWTCSGNSFALNWGGGSAQLIVSADGMRMSGPAGNALNSSTASAVRKSPPPASSTAAAPLAPTSGPAAALRVSQSPDEAAKLLEMPKSISVRGVYKLDLEYDFNVLDAAYYDANTKQITLVGHRDDRFQGPRIPYLQHLAVLLENPSPRFSLNFPPDSYRRAAAFFNWNPSRQEADRFNKQLTEFTDKNGWVTPVGRYMLPSFGVYPIADRKAPGYFGVETRFERSRTIISSVAPNSPAAQIGLAPGDRILQFNGRSVPYPIVLTRAARFAGAGTTVEVTAIRGGQFISERVTLTSDKDPNPWLEFTHFDAYASIFRTAGNERAALICEAVWWMGINEKVDPNNQLGSLLRLLDAMGLLDQVKGWEESDKRQNPGQAQLAERGRLMMQRLDDIFELPGRPLLTRFNNNVARGIRNDDMGVVLVRDFTQLLTPKIVGLLDDRMWNSREGFQMPPEVMEVLHNVRLEMVPDYRSVLANSLLARAMFDGDYTIKRLLHRLDLKSKFPRYQTQFEYRLANSQLHNQDSGNRAWISVGDIDVAQSTAGDVLEIRNVQMRLNIRKLDKNGIDLPNQQSDGYEDLLTSLYDDFAQEYPTLHELREIAKLAAMAIWIRAQTPNLRLPNEGRTDWRGPAKVPGLAYTYLYSGGGKPYYQMLVEGGAIINVEAFPWFRPSNDVRGNLPNAQRTQNAPITLSIPKDEAIVMRDSPGDDSYRYLGSTRKHQDGKESVSVTVASLSVPEQERALSQRDRKHRLDALFALNEQLISCLSQSPINWDRCEQLRQQLIREDAMFRSLGANISRDAAGVKALGDRLIALRFQINSQIQAIFNDPKSYVSKRQGSATASVQSDTGVFGTRDRPTNPNRVDDPEEICRRDGKRFDQRAKRCEGDIEKSFDFRTARAIQARDIALMLRNTQLARTQSLLNDLKNPQKYDQQKRQKFEEWSSKPEIQEVLSKLKQQETALGEAEKALQTAQADITSAPDKSAAEQKLEAATEALTKATATLSDTAKQTEQTIKKVVVLED